MENLEWIFGQTNNKCNDWVTELNWITSVGEDMQKLEPCTHCWWEYTNKVQLSCKRSWNFLKKLKLELQYGQFYFWPYTCKTWKMVSNRSVFTAAPFTPVRWEQPEWWGAGHTNCSLYINGMLASPNGKEILTCAATPWAALRPLPLPIPILKP